MDYVPLVFKALENEEWDILDAWFTDTEAKFKNPGEVSIPGISMLSGIISGNGIGSIVQCGHYVGYSTLLLGFLLRSMGKRNALFSIDIDPKVTEYTQSWVDRARLHEQVHLMVSNSADPCLPELAQHYLGAAPALVFIDSSHQYSHTLAELDLWWEALRPGGFLVLHDVSCYAQSFDSEGQGGVFRAITEWSSIKGRVPFLINNYVTGGDPNLLTYKDGCGLGLLQKPFAKVK